MKEDKIGKSYKFFLEKERNKEGFKIKDLSDATNWSEVTVKTYFSKKWDSILEKKDDEYFVKNISKYSKDQYAKLMSQNAKIIFAVIALLSYSITIYSQDKKAMNDSLQMQLARSGDGRPLLLVPGGLTGWISWQPFEEIFAAKKRSTLRVQLLNVQYGLEKRELPEDYSVKAESRALKAALDASGDTIPIDVVAWSFGALTALDYALDNPGRIRTLTLIEPPGFWVLRAMGPLNENERKTIEVMNGIHGEISEEMLEIFLFEAGFVQKNQSPRDFPQWKNWLPFRQSLSNTRQVISHEDNLQRLQNFNKPVLLVKGTGSSEWLHKVIDGLEKNLPDARVIELPRGHAPHLASREKFLIELEKFQSEN